MSGPLYFDDRDDWLAWRRMGGTTISAVLGVNPWQSPLHAYLTLTGLISDDRADTVATGLGRHMERYIADGWAAANGHALVDDPPGEGPCYDHPDEPRFTVSLDDQLIVGDGADLVEIKLTADRKAWKDGPPAHVEAQARWQLGIARANGHPATRCHVVCCSVPGWRFTEHHVDHDEDQWQAMYKAATAFLDNHVDPRVPPPAVAIDLDLLAPWAGVHAEPWHAEGDDADQLEQLAQDYCDTAAILRAAEKLQKDQKARLLQLMEGRTDAWLARDTDRKPLVTVRQQTRVSKCPECEHVLSDTTYPMLKVNP